MKHVDFTVKTDKDEETTIVSINLGRVGIELHCYQDEDGTDIIDVLEPIIGHCSRRLAFMADGQETKIYPLSGVGA